MTEWGILEEGAHKQRYYTYMPISDSALLITSRMLAALWVNPLSHKLNIVCTCMTTIFGIRL